MQVTERYGNESMRILVVNDLLQGGGVEKLMYDVVMRLHEQHEVAILTDKMDADFDKIYPADVKYFYQMEQEYPKGRNRWERKLIARRRTAVKGQNTPDEFRCPAVHERELDHVDGGDIW